jgi:putative ABC transport system permease protein
MAVAPYSLKAGFTTPDTRAVMGMAFLSDNPARSVAEMEATIQGLGITSAHTLYNVYSMLEQSRSILFVIDVFTYVFVSSCRRLGRARNIGLCEVKIKVCRKGRVMTDEKLASRIFIIWACHCHPASHAQCDMGAVPAYG